MALLLGWEGREALDVLEGTLQGERKIYLPHMVDGNQTRAKYGECLARNANGKLVRDWIKINNQDWIRIEKAERRKNISVKDEILM